MATPAVADLRSRFPALADGSHVPLDNAATTHRPQAVLDAIEAFYRESNANVHRANHRLGMAATEAYEGARRRVARFLEARPEEVVFTRNATEAINLVARSFVEPRLERGRPRGGHGPRAPQQPGALAGGLPPDGREPGRARRRRPGPAGRALGAPRGHALPGCDSRVQRDRDPRRHRRCWCSFAHEQGVPVLLDVSQSVGHLPLDEGSRQADFLALSGHKMYGPMGVGVLRGRSEHLQSMQPVMFGGDMVDRVEQDSASWQEPPVRFEAGTPAVAPVAALPPALDLLDEAGLAAIRAHELALLERLLDGVARVDGVQVVGPPTAAERSGTVSLAVPGGDPHVAATLLDLAGVAVRSGLHCAEPLLRRLGCGPTIRASLALYTSAEDVDRLLEALPEAVAGSREPAANP